MKKISFLFLLSFLTLMSKASTFIVAVGPNGTLTFAPSAVTALVGDTIKWVWETGSHTTTSTSVPNGAATWDAPINSTSTTFLYKITTMGTYSYKCSFHSGMTGSITVGTTSARGLEKLLPVRIYPNPVIGQLIVDAKGSKTGLYRIDIYDVLGNKISHLNQSVYSGEKLTIDMSAETAGMYFVYIIRDEDKEVFRIYKE